MRTAWVPGATWRWFRPDALHGLGVAARQDEGGADTHFADLKGAEERHGPFATYQEAEAEWSRHAWKTVDNAHFRYTVVSETVRV